jgi:amidase
VFALTGQVLLHQHHARYYARAQNLAPSVTAAYDRVFADVDVLAMPTTGMLPPPLPPTDADLVTTLTAAFASGGNTAVFDVTGHPAISLPCGDVDGLPVGLMLVGRRFEDDVVLRVAHAFEQLRAARG